MIFLTSIITLIMQLHIYRSFTITMTQLKKQIFQKGNKFQCFELQLCNINYEMQF